MPNTDWKNYPSTSSPLSALMLASTLEKLTLSTFPDSMIISLIIRSWWHQKFYSHFNTLACRSGVIPLNSSENGTSELTFEKKNKSGEKKKLVVLLQNWPWLSVSRARNGKHEMSPTAVEKVLVLENTKLLSPADSSSFFLPVISQKFGGSGLRYFLNFHNLSTEKNVPCLHIFFGVQFASAAVEQILGEEFPGKSQIWATEKCTSPGSRLTEQRFPFFTCLTFWPLCEGGWSLSGTRFTFLWKFGLREKGFKQLSSLDKISSPHSLSDVVYCSLFIFYPVSIFIFFSSHLQHISEH